jgi:hypothetical protein
MSKLITARMIRAKGSCYNPTDLPGVDSKTKWTLLEWINYKHYKEGIEDAIWVFCRMATEKMAREFAIWCACRIKTDSQEILKYRKVIKGYFFHGTHSQKQLNVAHWAACRATADRSTYRAAYWAAYWSTHRNAADRAAYWAADWSTDAEKERKAQIAKIKRMIKKGTK